MEEFNMECVYKMLSRYPGLPQAIRIDTVTRFVRLAASLRWSILHAQKPGCNEEEAPERLPATVHAFLGSALDLCDNFVRGCWDAFKGTIWQYNPTGTLLQQMPQYSTSMVSGIAYVRQCYF